MSICKSRVKIIFIYDSISKSEIVLNRKGYENIWVSISGGSDSDIIMDICSRLHAKVQYVFFNTGIEYSATLEHIDYLEEKYGVEIQREKALLSVLIPGAKSTDNLFFQNTLAKIFSDCKSIIFSGKMNHSLIY